MSPPDRATTEAPLCTNCGGDGPKQKRRSYKGAGLCDKCFRASRYRERIGTRSPGQCHSCPGREIRECVPGRRTCERCLQQRRKSRKSGKSGKSRKSRGGDAATSSAASSAAASSLSSPSRLSDGGDGDESEPASQDGEAVEMGTLAPGAPGHVGDGGAGRASPSGHNRGRGGLAGGFNAGRSVETFSIPDEDAVGADYMVGDERVDDATSPSAFLLLPGHQVYEQPDDVLAGELPPARGPDDGATQQQGADIADALLLGDGSVLDEFIDFGPYDIDAMQAIDSPEAVDPVAADDGAAPHPDAEKIMDDDAMDPEMLALNENELQVPAPPPPPPPPQQQQQQQQLPPPLAPMQALHRHMIGGDFGPIGEWEVANGLSGLSSPVDPLYLSPGMAPLTPFGYGGMGPPAGASLPNYGGITVQNATIFVHNYNVAGNGQGSRRNEGGNDVAPDGGMGGGLPFGWNQGMGQ